MKHIKEEKYRVDYYLHTILTRHENETTRQIYGDMKEDPITDDWIYLVYHDMTNINLNLSTDDIAKISKCEFKEINKTKSKALNYINHLIRNQMSSNKQTSLLFNLQRECVKN